MKLCIFAYGFYHRFVGLHITCVSFFFSQNLFVSTTNIFLFSDDEGEEEGNSKQSKTGGGPESGDIEVQII